MITCTTIVLLILVEVTRPILVLRLPGFFSVVSAIYFFLFLAVAVVFFLAGFAAALVLVAVFFLGAVAGGFLFGRLRLAGRSFTGPSRCRMALHHNAQLLFAHHRVDARHVLAQPANLVQALRLSHLQLELQTEKLVIELLLLVLQFGVGQVSKFFDIHVFLSSLLFVWLSAFSS